MFLAEIDLRGALSAAWDDPLISRAAQYLVILYVLWKAKVWLNEDLRPILEKLRTILIIVHLNSLRKRRISRPPGSKILKLVDFIFSSKTVERTFKPLVADMQFEYFEAMSHGMKWKARWIRIRYTYCAIMAMGPSKLWELAKMFLPSGKSEKADK